MTEPAFSPDVQELLSVLHEHGVEYLLVGGQAVVRHGYSRATGDVDLFYRQTPENCARLWTALAAWSRRLAEEATWAGKSFTIWIVGREDLLQAKRDAGRPKDLADIAFLEALGESAAAEGVAEGAHHS